MTVVSNQKIDFDFTVSLPDFGFRLFTGKFLLDHRIRPRQHARRNREADLLGGLQIYYKIEFSGLLDG